MTKVYPNATAAATAASAELEKGCEGGNSVVLTVWKKSLLLNCNGFTVFDGKGNLVYRVDNYCSRTKDEIILMDAYGNSLLTIRRKRLSLSDNWVIYDGEKAINPKLSVTKHVNLLNTKSLAYVSSGGCTSSIGIGIGMNTNKNKNKNKSKSKSSVIYEIEGSYMQRCCAVYDTKRRRVAEIKPKEAVGLGGVGVGVSFGMDVFRLVVHPQPQPQPEFDSSIAMAFVILLDQMFPSSKRFSI